MKTKFDGAGRARRKCEHTIQRKVPINQLAIGDLISVDGDIYHRVTLIRRPTPKMTTWSLMGTWGEDPDEFSNGSFANYAVLANL